MIRAKDYVIRGGSVGDPDVIRTFGSHHKDTHDTLSSKLFLFMAGHEQIASSLPRWPSVMRRTESAPSSEDVHHGLFCECQVDPGPV